MSYQQKQKPKFPEVICEDFKSFKGCGKIVLMKKTGNIKEDGKPEWKKFELDGMNLHTHDGSGGARTAQASLQPTNTRPPPGDPPRNPNSTPNTIILERQVATLAQTVDNLKLQIQQQQKQIDTLIADKTKRDSEVKAIVEAPEDDLSDADVLDTTTNNAALGEPKYE